jgi:hypothetical protein
MRREGNSWFEVDTRQLPTIVRGSCAGGRLVTNPSVCSLDVFQLQLALGNLGLELGARLAGQFPYANHTSEAVLAQEPTGETAHDTRHKEIELKTGRLECCNETEED